MIVVCVSFAFRVECEYNQTREVGQSLRWSNTAINNKLRRQRFYLQILYLVLNQSGPMKERNMSFTHFKIHTFTAVNSNICVPVRIQLLCLKWWVRTQKQNTNSLQTHFAKYFSSLTVSVLFFFVIHTRYNLMCRPRQRRFVRLTYYYWNTF